MSASDSPYFFISYSREDTNLQERVVRVLRKRGVAIWLDVENLIPGTPAWEREVERSIRGAAGVIVLLSPSSNSSEWVRREISFADGNNKRIFPVLIRGDENVSIPLRLSTHQRVDLRSNFNAGIGYLVDTLNDFLGVTRTESNGGNRTGSFNLPNIDFKKYAGPGLIAVVGLALLGGLFFAANNFINNKEKTPEPPVITPSDADASITEIATEPFPDDEPSGRIIYTCQIQGDEICIINADGSGWRRLTNTNFANFNASLSPDGQSAVYIANDGNTTEIYELDVDSGISTRLTDLGKSLGSPEISPDDQYIVFHYRAENNNLQLWMMKRDGSDPQEIYSRPGWDAHDGTWSPDGNKILFAFGLAEHNKLYILDFSGREPFLLNNSMDTRGRSDWSVGNLIVLDMGDPFMHEVYLMNDDGSNLHQVSASGMNSQGASLSPDGEWIAFTAYTNLPDDLNSCEIFIQRVDGTDLRQLTNNSYCDYQPRWGN